MFTCRHLPCSAVYTLVFSISLFLFGCTTTQAPAISYDGLELVSQKPLDVIYRKPGANVSEYQQFIVGDCSVAFRDRWQRDQNSSSRNLSSRISDEDMAKTKARLGELCREVFIEELGKEGGYTIADKAANGVLELRPSIVDLDITAPDTMTTGRSRSYTTTAGSMTLYLEVFDSVSGEILGRVVDKRKTPDNTRMEWTNSVTNTRDAKLILRYWGKALHEMIENARAP